ncbi:hypothetical protein B5807_08102 [Epicoccum nigrum]|uniref:Pre-mRNA-splicing factor 38B n=1 Tax=Epicoccum nigrum TaxID=105696 RepID=A0A1Y2LQ42_EPING|nr:hypothetical protein B5807_08102 [Epicoccum nigrum]
MPLDIDDDEYIAKLLAQDAKKTSKTYDLVGINAFNPKRSRPGAPKPNTHFLRHIIRQTDSHNAALLAKEAEESSSRLRQMNREREKERTEAVDRAKRKIEGRLSPSPKNEDSRQRYSKRGAKDDDERNYGRGHDRDRRDHSDYKSGKYRDRSEERSRLKRRHEDSEDDRTSHRSRRSKHHHESSRRSHHGRDEKSGGGSHHRSRKTQRSYSSSPSRSRSRSPRRKTHRRRDRSRSPRHPSRHTRDPEKSRRRSKTHDYGSDPLEAIVGPLPPPAEPTVRSRGRGALKANSPGIESRFSSNYDPSIDVRAGSDAEGDWDEALEAMRDRQRWQQQGAERLRAAGFKDEQVKKWEKGGDPLEEDVVWTKKGQDREWDRGKFVDDDGDVALQAEWGRLK